MIWILGIAALLTSTLSAIIGMGGGITLLGVMTIFLPASQIVPVHGVVQLVSNSTRTLVFLKHVAWKIYAFFVPTAILGMWLASMVWSGSKLEWLKIGIGVFLIVFVLWHRLRTKTIYNPPMWAYIVLGMITGFLGVFVGAVGPFLAPFFIRDDFSNEQVIATKAMCQTTIHFLKIPIFFSVGFNYFGLLPLFIVMIPAVIVGTLIGKRLLSYLPKTVFVAIFETALAIMGIYLITASF